MKLVHPDYAFEIKFQEGIVQKIILETPKVMSEMIVDIKNQIEGKEGRWILSKEGEILKISEKCDLIMNIFDLEINQRKMLNALYEKLANEIMDTELLIEWRNINCHLESVLNSAIDEVGYTVEYGEIDIKAYLKMMDVKFQKSEEGYLEHFLEYLQLISEVRKIHIFIIVNISAFLAEEEIKYLYQEAFYRKYQLLFLDIKNIIIKEEIEHTIIVDKDYCVIETTMR